MKLLGFFLAAMALLSLATATAQIGLPWPGPGAALSTGSACSGTINLSTGCAQPMLGGL